jgi:hypothetical protein
VAGLFNWGGRKESAQAAPLPPAAASAPTRATKVLPRFLSALAAIESPVLINLGPVVGQNIAFLGERLGCKIFVEDLGSDLASTPAAGLEAMLQKRLAHPPGSVDGILCWDLFDWLDRPTSQVLSAYLVKLLKPGGVLYAFFGATNGAIEEHTRFVIAAPDGFELRTTAATPRARNVLVTRDINKMFDGLVVTESVLLKSNTRETLFRRPS